MHFNWCVVVRTYMCVDQEKSFKKSNTNGMFSKKTIIFALGYLCVL
jgi:hypothetical protein